MNLYFQAVPIFAGLLSNNPIPYQRETNFWHTQITVSIQLDKILANSKLIAVMQAISVLSTSAITVVRILNTSSINSFSRALQGVEVPIIWFREFDGKRQYDAQPFLFFPSRCT